MLFSVGGDKMTDYYKGHRVVASDDGDVAFWSQLFFSLDDVAGPLSCMKVDPELRLHYRAILDRLSVLSGGDSFSRVEVLYLAD